MGKKHAPMAHAPEPVQCSWNWGGAGKGWYRPTLEPARYTAGGNLNVSRRFLELQPPTPYVPPVVPRPDPASIPPAPKRVVHAATIYVRVRHACGHEQEHVFPGENGTLNVFVECDGCKQDRKLNAEQRSGYFNILSDRGDADAWSHALSAYPEAAMPIPYDAPEPGKPYVREYHKFRCGHWSTMRFYGERGTTDAAYRKEAAAHLICPECRYLSQHLKKSLAS